MFIRYGYEITINCWNPTAVVTLLTIRDGREADIRAPEVFSTDPAIESTTYRDLFGNVCRRFVAPPGNLTFRSDGIRARGSRSREPSGRVRRAGHLTVRRPASSLQCQAP